MIGLSSRVVAVSIALILSTAGFITAIAKGSRGFSVFLGALLLLETLDLVHELRKVPSRARTALSPQAGDEEQSQIVHPENVEIHEA